VFHAWGHDSPLRTVAPRDHANQREREDHARLKDGETMTHDDDFLDGRFSTDATPPSPDTTAPSLSTGSEDAIPWIPRATPPDEFPAPEERNAWAPWSLAIALVALVFGGVVAIIEINAPHVTYDKYGYPALAPIPGGPAWLQGRFLSSWWAVAALLLIVVAVAVGMRSFTLISRRAAPGLGITVSGFLVSSTALMVGDAILAGLLGFTTGLVLNGVYSDRHGPEGTVATSAALYPRTNLTAHPAAVQKPARIPPRTVAILAFVCVVLGPTLSRFGFAGALAGMSLFLFGCFFAIDALRSTRATGEPGRGWAVSAIIVISIMLVFTVCLLLLIWGMSQLEWA